MEKVIILTKQMSIHHPFDLILRINLGEILGKNSQRLVKFIQEFVKSRAETSSKMPEPKT